MRRAVVLLLFSPAGFAADSFQFEVGRVRPLWRDERGHLDISASGVSYQSDDGKTSLRIAWEDVREADVTDPKLIRIETYDRLKRKAGERRAPTQAARRPAPNRATVLAVKGSLRRANTGRHFRQECVTLIPRVSPKSSSFSRPPAIHAL